MLNNTGSGSGASSSSSSPDDLQANPLMSVFSSMMGGFGSGGSKTRKTKHKK
jgi:hypothetical protein